MRMQSSITILITSYRKNWIEPPIFFVISKPKADNRLPIKSLSHYMLNICSWINVHIHIPPFYIDVYLYVDYHLYRQLSIFNTHLSSILKKCLNDDYYSENGVSKYYQQEYYNIDKFKESYERDHGYNPTDK